MNLNDLSDKQRDMILAALCLYQTVYDETGGDLPADILDIAKNGREDEDELNDSMLSLEEIDELRERLNCDSSDPYFAITVKTHEEGSNTYIGRFPNDTAAQEWADQNYPLADEDDETPGAIVSHEVVLASEFIGDDMMELCSF